MPKRLSTKTQKYIAIKEMTNMGYSSRRITKVLKDVYGSGIRRKRLLTEMRLIKKTRITTERREKSIPKRYRVEKPRIEKEIPLQLGYIYRGSLVISSVPLHSRPFYRHYFGFRLNVFSYSKKEISSALRNMKKEFIRMVSVRLGSSTYAKEQIIGIERATRLAVYNSDSLNGKWFFAVEEQGRDVGSESGYI